MLAPRDLSAEDLALKSRARLLIERVGGLDAAAACSRVSRSVLSGYQSPHVCQFMPVDVIARLEQVAEAPLVTEELARRAGYALTRSSSTVRGSVPELLARLGGECAELHAAFAKGIADGELCEVDRAAITQEATHVLRKVSDLLAVLDMRPGSIQHRGPA